MRWGWRNKEMRWEEWSWGDWLSMGVWWSMLVLDPFVDRGDQHFATWSERVANSIPSCRIPPALKHLMLSPSFLPPITALGFAPDGDDHHDDDDDEEEEEEDDDDDDDAARNVSLTASYTSSKSPSAIGESLTTTEGGQHSGIFISGWINARHHVIGGTIHGWNDVPRYHDQHELGSELTIQAVAFASIECIQQLLANLWVGALGCSSGFSLSEDCWRNIPF